MAGTRCTTLERKAFRAWAYNGLYAPPEPALGTLDDRLRVLAQRQGLRVGRIVLSDSERAEVAAAWVRA